MYRLTCASLRASPVAGGAEAAEPALPVCPGQRLLGGKASGAAGSRALARERAAAQPERCPLPEAGGRRPERGGEVSVPGMCHRARGGQVGVPMAWAPPAARSWPARWEQGSGCCRRQARGKSEAGGTVLGALAP